MSHPSSRTSSPKGRRAGRTSGVVACGADSGHGGGLPFLFKVLTVDSALSIQVRDREDARDHPPLARYTSVTSNRRTHIVTAVTRTQRLP
eukprot:3134286-Prymnesium_polylepis.2